MRNITHRSVFVFILLIAFSSLAIAQNEFKVGDKVEANFLGTWLKGEVKGYENGRFKVYFDDTKSELKFRVVNIKLQTSTASAAPENTVEPSSNAPINQTKESSAKEPCEDWSAWGKMTKLIFNGMASDKYSTGFSIPTESLICHVKTRKVDFKLSPSEEANLMALRNSADLIQALKANYVPEKAVDNGTASSIKPGRYVCGVPGKVYQAKADLFILTNSQYKTLDSTGQYTFNSTTNKIRWTSGPYNNANMTGEYFPNINTITHYNTSGQILYNCNWAGK